MIDFAHIPSGPRHTSPAPPAQGPVPQEFSVPLPGRPGWVARYRFVRGASGAGTVASARLEWAGIARPSNQYEVAPRD